MSEYCKNCFELTEKLDKKEQECEIWKNQVLTINEEDVTVQVTQEQFEEYQKLKQECEELKKENQNLKNMYNSMSDLCEIKDEAILDKNADIEELSQHCFEYSYRIHNFKKALDEIMKFINISTCNICKGEDTQACLECNVNTIKTFINKAKEENDETL